MSPRDPDGCVLVVEDHPPTAELLVNALEEVRPSISSQVVHDGRDCLSVLRDQDDPLSPPDIVLLDLDLPIVDGFTVLGEIEESRALRQIPFVVLSETDDPGTVERCYELGATGFISKPNDFDGFLSISETLVQYWFSTTELPTANKTPG